MPPLMPDEDKNLIGGSLVLDFGMRWHHVKTICRLRILHGSVKILFLTQESNIHIYIQATM